MRASGIVWLVLVLLLGGCGSNEAPEVKIDEAPAATVPDGRLGDAIRPLAYRLDLLSTGGSDWHGDRGGGMEPGTEKVPMEWMEAVAARCGVSL